MNASTFSEPFTPRGVATFARVKFSRLLLAQFIAALLAAAAVAWILDDSCFPTIREAIHNLPNAGKISAGQLDWHGNSTQMLAEGKLLAFDVDPDHSGQIQSPRDFRIEFGRESVRVFSLLGYAEFFYAPNETISFNRTELEPLWNAWAAEILFAAAAATAVALMASWWILATIYFLPVWLLGFFANRNLNFRASWKLSGAALLPGALLMTAGVLLYDFGFLDLVSFGFVLGAHFVLGWIYLCLSLIFLPRISETQKKNPFKQPKA
jgi:hypothetical protein